MGTNTGIKTYSKGLQYPRKIFKRKEV